RLLLEPLPCRECFQEQPKRRLGHDTGKKGIDVSSWGAAASGNRRRSASRLDRRRPRWGAGLLPALRTLLLPILSLWNGLRGPTTSGGRRIRAGAGAASSQR